MADDIDDLLDECETKFCGNSKSSSQNHPNKTNSRSSKKSTRNEKIGTKRFVVFFNRTGILKPYVLRLLIYKGTSTILVVFLVHRPKMLNAMSSTT